MRLADTAAHERYTRQPRVDTTPPEQRQASEQIVRELAEIAERRQAQRQVVQDLSRAW